MGLDAKSNFPIGAVADVRLVPLPLTPAARAGGGLGSGEGNSNDPKLTQARGAAKAACSSAGG